MQKRILFFLTFVVLVALAARLVPGPRTIDDSYITFRYARNILGGGGFNYNPGERILGTTTPLYTFLIAALGALTGGTRAPFPILAMVVNALADSITCLMLFWVGKNLKAGWAGAGAALVWAVAPFSVTFAIGGLETSLYVLFLTSTAAFHLAGKHKTAAAMGALALLTRPDALILLGPIALDRMFQIWQDHRHYKNSLSEMLQSAWKEAAIFLIPTGIWFGFAALYFGSPLPHSIAAKTLAYRLSAEAGFVRLLQHYATPFLGHLTFGLNWIKIGLILYPFLFLIGARSSLKANVRVWPWLLYPWLYFATFSIANPLIFRWYMTPPLPVYILVILIGAQNLVSGITQALKKPMKSKLGLSIVSTSLLLIVTILTPTFLELKDWKLHPAHGLDRPAPEMAWYEIELFYHQAAKIVLEDLAAHPITAPVLAAGDVGVLGYDTGVRILDTVGLNSGESLEYYPLDPSYYVINYAIPPNLILDQKPDYIVVLEVYIRNSLLQNEQFQKSYKLLSKLPNDIYGSDGMLIFTRIPGS